MDWNFRHLKIIPYLLTDPNCSYVRIRRSDPNDYEILLLGSDCERRIEMTYILTSTRNTAKCNSIPVVPTFALAGTVTIAICMDLGLIGNAHSKIL